LGGRPRCLKFLTLDGLAREWKAHIHLKVYSLLFLDTKMAIEATTLLPAFIDARNPDRTSSIDESGNLRSQKHLPEHLSSSDLILPPIGPIPQILNSSPTDTLSASSRSPFNILHQYKTSRNIFSSKIFQQIPMTMSPIPALSTYC
jgi:hypothetical protein